MVMVMVMVMAGSILSLTSPCFIPTAKTGERLVLDHRRTCAPFLNAGIWTIAFRLRHIEMGMGMGMGMATIKLPFVRCRIPKEHLA